jgi:hypothetical protein
VLAGSAVEAILLWKIKACDPKILSQAVAAYDTKAKQPLGGKDPEYWALGEYITVAREGKLISETTAKAADLCREFRNLIHPGRVLRTGADASKATALTALAAMELLLE